MAKQFRSFEQTIARQRKFIEAEARSAVNETGQELLTKFRRVVRDWSHKPGFRAASSRKPGVYSLKITPTGRYAPIFRYVDSGTKPHVIAAKNVPMLKFQTGYSARTAPPALFNQGTGQRFGNWVQKQEVQHPGTEAREFSKTFLEELTPSFPDRISAAIQLGLTKANR